MAGAGSATYSVDVSSDSLFALTLNLSTMIASDVVVVDMARKKITKNGVETPSLYVSGDYFVIEPSAYQGGSLTTLNGTNATTVTTWRPAFSD
jgi:phage-related protein